VIPVVTIQTRKMAPMTITPTNSARRRLGFAFTFFSRSRRAIGAPSGRESSSF
jgi:hypothetical protein